MKTENRRIFRVLILALAIVLALGTFSAPRASGLAAPLQQEDLPACSAEVSLDGETGCNDLQVILIIDDSRSMLTNDPNQARFVGVERLVDILAERYLSVVDAGLVQLPTFEVAAVHFGSNVPEEFVTTGVTIAPQTSAEWDQQKTQVYEQLIAPQLKENRFNLNGTNFVRPFARAALLAGDLPQPDETGCPNRVVLVLTDGAPAGATVFTGQQLEDHMDQVAAIVDDSFAAEGTAIYVSAINVIGNDYWAETAPYWTEITRDAPDADPAFSTRVQNAEALASRINDIVATSVGLRSIILESDTVDVPAYLESLRITFFAPAETATLEVIDPQGNPVVPDGDRVILTGEGTVGQVLEIFDPLPGTYTLNPSLPGGSINLIFVYAQSPAQIENNTPVLQQFTAGELLFTLVDADGDPFAFSDEFPVRFFGAVTPPGGVSSEEPWTTTDGSFQVPLLPAAAGSGQFSVAGVTTDINGQDCLLFSAGDDFEVDPVTIMAGPPVEGPVCTPSEMPVTFPLELINGRTSQATTIDLPIMWTIQSATVAGDPVEATVQQTQVESSYQVSLTSNNADDIETSVAARVTLEGDEIEFYQEDFVTTGLVQDQSYAFEILGVEEQADPLSIRFNVWFGKIRSDEHGERLIGRKLFGWLGPQEVQVRAHFVDQDSGERVAGIERFWVELVATQTGSPATGASNDWQPADDGSHVLILPAPPVGSYQVLVSDRGETAACVEVGPPLGLNILLIIHYWEFIFWIVLILILLILLIWWLLWLLCCKRKPLRVFLEDATFLNDAPADEGGHRVALPMPDTPLFILEAERDAIKKIGRETEWLLVYTQPVGHVLDRQVRTAEGATVLDANQDAAVEIKSKTQAGSETVLRISHPIPAEVLERSGDWLKVRATVVGYVPARLVKPPRRSLLRIRCRRPSPVTALRQECELKDAPLRDGGYAVASLGRANDVMILEDAANALQKMERQDGWVLVRTVSPGYLTAGQVQSGQTVIPAGESAGVDVYESPGGNLLMRLLHPVPVQTGKAAGENWLEAMVAAVGYIRASNLQPPEKKKKRCRRPGPVIVTGLQVSEEYGTAETSS